MNDFNGVWLPGKLIACKYLPMVEKCLLAYLDIMSNENSETSFSNKELAEIFRINHSTISGHITNLKRCGCLDEVSFDGKTRVLKSNMTRMFGRE
jgi:predicted transcriptional regulator